MESYKEMVNNSRILLDDGNYGFWKARIRSMIKGIDPLAWKAVTDKWEEPLVADANGVFHQNQKKVGLKRSPKEQSVETAKEACDILQMQYEGTTKVQNSRKDMLASRFENLKMEDNETISEFSSKLSALAQEAAVLGKKYKDKKPVKKFLRCLPSRFMGYKSALSVSSNTENMPFSELVGMLKAHEMELDSLKKPKSLAIKCENRTTEDEEDDPISLLKKVASFKKTAEGDKSNRKSEVQCHECKGYGHFKNDCPTIKRREIQCYGCKGFGHTQLECVNDQNRRKDKSMLAEEESDDDSEDDSVEETNNFVTFIGIAEIKEGQESESEPEEEKEDDLISSYKEVRHVLVSLNKENSELKKENQRLSVLVDKLSKDLEAANALGQGSVNLIKEKLELANNAESLRQHLKVEKQISEKLESELDQLKKQIQMFAGTKQLDKILSYGCQANTRHGLGYSGWEQRSSDEINFVSSGYNQPEGRRPVTKQQKGRECYYCGKIGHIKAYCYSRWNRVQKLMKQRKFSWNGSTNQVWVRKEDLRFEPKGQLKKNPIKPREFTVKRSSRNGPMSMLWHGFKCNMAQVESDEDELEPWYFDSGCSRHMTGNRSYLRNGLKENLISISQLCDEGLIVIFTDKGCRAVNDDGQIILAGERSGNNCYMWNKSGSVISCFTACDNLQLWHQRLGHMNIRNLNDLISKESIRGVPKIKGGDKFVCEACNQGKQIEGISKLLDEKIDDVASQIKSMEEQATKDAAVIANRFDNMEEEQVKYAHELCNTNKIMDLDFKLEDVENSLNEANNESYDFTVEVSEKTRLLTKPKSLTQP
ncbi:uncharacterized protein LOC112084527 [Eutrema salsugineum]|uniref:uncharacterized protein LOC112084527 n=1 Tax=Eutrema salsugineum TaxID=72664 RepID=UPI000CED0F6E|nr:uncharacterized protein LOC112084527 [Eutrema salsugineum]